MKKWLLVIAAVVFGNLIVAGGLAWATGIVDPMSLFSDPKRTGTISLAGVVAVGEAELPISAWVDLYDRGDPQVRRVIVGEGGIDLAIPIVVRREIESRLGVVAELVGTAARLSVGPVKFGFYVDALRVDLEVRLLANVPNPYVPAGPSVPPTTPTTP